MTKEEPNAMLERKKKKNPWRVHEPREGEGGERRKRGKRNRKEGPE